MLKRSIRIDRAAAKKESGDLIIPMAFASEEPYERWWGIEILDTSEGSIRLERLNDGANVLFNHNPNDLRGVHVRDSVRTGKDKVLRGDVRLTSATQAGRDTIALVETDVLTKASVGYRVHKVIQQTTGKDGKNLERTLDGQVFERLVESAAPMRHAREAFYRSIDSELGRFERAKDGEPDVFRVVDWEPYENSLVTIPADATVGVGRSADANVQVEVRDERTERKPAAPAAHKEHQMPEAQAAAAGAAADVAVLDKPKTPDPVQAEKIRRLGIENMCKANKIEDATRDYWIRSGAPVEIWTEQMVQILEERGRTNPQSAAQLGLSKKEIKKFNLCRAIDACGSQNWKDAGFEAEASQEIAKRIGKLDNNRNSIFVPLEIQERQNRTPIEDLAYSLMKRDLTSGTGSQGGFLVQTTNVGFIELLRNRSVLMSMGARRLTGLQGNVAIPKQTTANTVTWLANEASTISETNAVFAQVALAPKTVGGYQEISRLLLLQSNPSAEGLVMADLSAIIALAADLAGITGSGAAGQPTGIINTAGIGGVTGTSIAYAGIVEFQSDVATGNALTANCGYITTPVVAGLLKQRVKYTSTASPLWDGQLLDANVDGYRGMASNQVPTGDILFGDFGQVVFGEWGVLELEVNPYANFQAGIVGVRALYTLDVGVRIPGAFSLATSVT